MTARVLVVDDEPDVEALFRQQFRRKVRQGLYTLDFALSATALAADEFLTKPVDFPKLKQDIMAVMTDATGGSG
jgi:CheY-like chemotaxis protein